MADELTDKQKMFITEYLVNGFNATQAAIKAGYSEDTAKQQGSRLLTNVDIRKAINDEINRALDDKRDELKTQVIAEYKKIALSDIKNILKYDQDGVVISPSDDVDTSVVSSVEIEQEVVKIVGDVSISNKKIKLKLYDKIKALEGLSKYLGLTKDTIDIPGGIHIHIDKEDAEL
jgi:phage terminase small subunit